MHRESSTVWKAHRHDVKEINSLEFSSLFPKENAGMVFLVGSWPEWPTHAGSLYLPGPGPSIHGKELYIFITVRMCQSPITITHLFPGQR